MIRRSLMVLSLVLPENPGVAQNLPTDIPLDLWSRKAETLLRHGYQQGQFTTNAPGKTVHVFWTAAEEIHNEPPSVPPVLDPNVYDHEDQIIGARYHPTACAVIDYRTALVGGVTEGGKTVIEKWTFSWPSIMPAPSGVPGQGPGTVDVVTPSRTGVDVLYSATVVGKDIVRNLHPILVSGSASGEALVQFDDSSDVHTMDLVSGLLTLLASPSGPSPIGPVPQLSAHAYNSLWGKERLGMGYVYVFTVARRTFDSATMEEAVVLQDADKDGVIEAVQVVPPTSWFGSGQWGDATTYVDWWR